MQAILFFGPKSPFTISRVQPDIFNFKVNIKKLGCNIHILHTRIKNTFDPNAEIIRNDYINFQIIDLRFNRKKFIQTFTELVQGSI